MEKAEYRRHEPEQTLLYAVVREHFESFLEEVRTRASGAELPRYVVGAFRRFLKCGILQHGFVRVRCKGCG